MKSQAIEQISVSPSRCHGQSALSCKPTLAVLRVTKTVAKNVNFLSRLKYSFSDAEACKTFFEAHIIMSRIKYVLNAWDSCSEVHIKKHIITQKSSQSSSHGFTNVLFILTVKQHLQHNKYILVH